MRIAVYHMLVSILKPLEVDAAYASAQCAVEVHRRLAAFLRVGQTLAQIDAFVGKTLEVLDCTSCFKSYVTRGHGPFPAHACLSVNQCIVHGHPMAYTAPIAAGDLVKLDIGVMHRGWIGDVGWTYCMGEPTGVQRKLMDCGKEALRRGIATIHPKNTLSLFAKAVEQHVEKECGFFCVSGLGGHGYGRKLHGVPYVPNYMPGLMESPWPEGKAHWVAGMLVAVEPMISVGTRAIRDEPHPYNRNWTDWPVYTADGSLSVHFEHDILVTEEGCRVLSEGMEAIDNIIKI